MPQYGYSAPRFNTDSTLQLPTFNGVPTLKSNKTNKGAIAIDSTNGRFYFYNPKTSAWSQVTGGSSIDTTSLSNRINLKIDSLKRFNDTVYSYKNGSRAFAFKDSVGTNPAPVGYYGSFYDTTIQTAAAINTPYAMKLSNTDLSNGISISNNSRINIAHTGVYNIQFSAQFDRTNSGTDVIDIWLRKNGINVTGSAGKIVLSGSATASQMIASWNYVLSAIDNDYFEIMWSTPDTHVRLLSEVTQTSPFAHPNIPSVILTVTQQSGIMAGTGIQAADTTAMLIPYMKKNDSTIYYSKYRSDTSRTNIYSGINVKLNTSDSTIYYTKYKSDTSRSNIYSAINGKLNKSDSTIYYSKYSSDTSRTNIYSSINGKLAISDTSVFQRKSLSSYSFQANKTNATANATNNTFIDTAGVYTGTPVYSGTAPSGTTNHTFKYTQVGKMCTIQINLSFSAGGSPLSISMPLPSICATPLAPTGMGADGELLYTGVGLTWTTRAIPIGAGLNSARACWMRVSSGVYQITVFNFSASSSPFVSATLTYWTN